MKLLIPMLLVAVAMPTWADGANRSKGSKNAEQYQAVEMVSLSDNSPQGAAWLIRSRNQIEGRVMVNVETAGDPYTVWWIVFNNPKKCLSSPCGATDLVADLTNPKVGVSIFSATGAISAHNGKIAAGDSQGVINVDMKTVGGKYPEGLFVLEWIDGTPFGDRLRRGNGFGAEVHLVVDRHPDLESWAKELTTTNLSPNSNHRAAIFLPPH